MKKFQFKHTVKLKRKQASNLYILARLIVGVIPFISLITLEHTFSSFLVKEFSFPLFLKYSALAFFILNTSLIYFFSEFSPSKIQRIKSKLKKIIEINNFFYANELSGTITHSMMMKFYFIGDLLYIEVYPDGGKHSSKTNSLTNILQTALNLTVISVQDDNANHTTYILSKFNANPINVNNEWGI